MRKIIIVILLLIVSLNVSGCSNNERVEIDPFSNLVIKERGFEGNGYLVLDTLKPLYNGDNKKIKQIIKTSYYKIEPNKKLKNKDVVCIRYVLNKNRFDNSNIKLTKSSIEYKVSKLKKKNITHSYENETITTMNGEKEVKKEFFIFEGVKIPRDWDLSDEEMQDYVEYVKKCEDENIPTPENDKVVESIIWHEGSNDKITFRKNSSFYVKDYDFSITKCYEATYQYGDTSSQKFRIEPIVDGEQEIGYQCIFE